MRFLYCTLGKKATLEIAMITLRLQLVCDNLEFSEPILISDISVVATHIKKLTGDYLVSQSSVLA